VAERETYFPLASPVKMASALTINVKEINGMLLGHRNGKLIRNNLSQSDIDSLIENKKKIIEENQKWYYSTQFNEPYEIENGCSKKKIKWDLYDFIVDSRIGSKFSWLRNEWDNEL